MIRHRRQGMTIIEGLIGLGLALLLSWMVFWVIFPAFRVVQEGQILTELQQQGELAVQQLSFDLGNSVPTGISLAFPVNAGDGMIVAAQPLSQVLSTGTLQYDQRLVIWFHEVSKGRLRRKTYAPGDPSLVVLPLQTFTAFQTTRGNLEQICNSSNGSERNCALSVESFRVEKESTTGGEVYACRILLSKDIPGKNRKAVSEIFRKVMLRNHM